MRTRIYFSTIVVLVVGFMNAFAQNAKLEMAGSFGSSGSDEPRYAVTDTDGNYYIAGLGAGTITFSDGTILTGRGGNDALVAKYDSDMNLLWARYVGGTGAESFEGVAVASNGDVYAVGLIATLSTIDGTEETISKVNTNDGVIVVYDKDGNYKSHKTIAGAGNTYSYAVQIDADDNVYIWGNTIGGDIDFGNGKTITPASTTLGFAFLAKFDATLNCLWAIPAEVSGGTSITGNVTAQMTLDKDNNIIVASRFIRAGAKPTATITITGTDNNSISNTKQAQAAVFVTKITPAGVCSWIKTIITETAYELHIRGLASDSQGRVIISGSSNSGITPEGASDAYSFAGNYDNYLVIFDAASNYVDGFSLGGAGRDEGKSVFVDNKDNIYIAGNMNGVAGGTTINMNPKGETEMSITCYGHDGYFAKYNGTTLELMQIEKTTSPSGSTPHEIAFNITMSKDYKKIYLLGHYNNSNTIFDGAKSEISFTNKGNYDFFWTVYNTDIEAVSLTNATQNTAYSVSIAEADFQGEPLYSLYSGTLPVGLSLETDNIEGTPTELGTTEFTVMLKDASSAKLRNYSIEVKDSGQGTGCTEIKSLNNYIVYPVPAETEFTLNASFMERKDVEIKIVNALSTSVWSQTFKSVDTLNETISVNNLSSGIYFVILQTNEGQIAKRLVVK